MGTGSGLSDVAEGGWVTVCDTGRGRDGGGGLGSFRVILYARPQDGLAVRSVGSFFFFLISWFLL